MKGTKTDMDEAFAYCVSIRHENTDTLCTIRTHGDIYRIAERLNATPEEIACRIMNRRPPCGTMDYASVRPDEVTEIQDCHTNIPTGLTILVKDPVLEFGYYIYPEGASRISVHRFDRNTGESYMNEFLVPNNILNMDCNGKFVRKLFLQIAREFNHANNKQARGVFTWHDFISIPNEFLKRYGVEQLEKPDIMLYVNVDANENLVDPEE